MALFENFPYTNLHNLNLDWIIQVIKKFESEYPDVMEELKNKIPYPVDDPYGQAGNILISNGDGSVSWEDLSPEWTEHIYEAVAAWLNDHPEATTTVQDGSLTAQKFTDQLKLETIKDYGTPEMYGGVGDGLADDTVAFQYALNNHGTVILTHKYRISDTVNIPSHKSILFFGDSQVIADIPNGVSSPLFMMDTVSNVEVIGFGGGEPNIKGNCPIAFHIKGSDNFSISPANYSKFIRFKDLWITDASGIRLAFYLDTAVRQLNIDGCTVYCNNGIYVHGKTVENNITNSLLWATDTGGYAFKMDSALGGALYSEGWTFSGCTIDCTDKVTGAAFDVADYWVLQLCNSYVGAPIKASAPTTTNQSQDFLISNCVIYNNVSATGQTNFHMKINNCAFINGSLYVNNNARFVSLADTSFTNGPDKVAVVIQDGASRINIHDVKVDNTYDGGVVVNGVNGTDISVINFTYEGSGSIIYTARPIKTINAGMPISTRTAIARAAVPVGDPLGSCTRTMIAGTKFLVNIQTTLTGGRTTSGGQILNLVPTNATGGGYIPFYGGTQCITGSRLFTVTETGPVTITLTNYAGNTVTTDYHDFIEIVELPS